MTRQNLINCLSSLGSGNRIPTINIKGKYAVRARVTGNIGIYHLQACRSYPALTKPDRWFCSEEDAQAAGFRRAYNCRAGTKSK